MEVPRREPAPPTGRLFCKDRGGKLTCFKLGHEEATQTAG
jgi:hypothetical protein